jgi:hypothetical protein
MDGQCITRSLDSPRSGARSGTYGKVKLIFFLGLTRLHNQGQRMALMVSFPKGIAFKTHEL